MFWSRFHAISFSYEKRKTDQLSGLVVDCLPRNWKIVGSNLQQSLIQKALKMGSNAFRLDVQQ